jgi:leader peptidase (prepilin peptidase)/N-methyltransferase
MESDPHPADPQTAPDRLGRDDLWRPPAHVARVRRRLRWRANWPLRLTILAMLGSLSAYVLVDSYIGARRSGGDLWLHLVYRLGSAFFIAWMAYFGGAVGSFLNVVAYRLPRGMSLNGRSKCPFCNTQILARHNVPVLGWLILRGRCDACRLPISPRYPLVELLVAACFLWIGWQEVYRNLANLPLEPVVRSQAALPAFRPTAATFGIAGFHLTGITCLLAMALTRLDGQRLPAKLTAFSLFVILLPPWFWPRLCQVPANLTLPDAWSPIVANRGDVAMFQLCGVAIAIFLAKLIGVGRLPLANLKLDPQLPDSQRLLDLACGLSLSGLLIGWQATLAATPWAIAIAIVPGDWSRGWRTFDVAGRILLGLAIACTLHIAHWYTLSRIAIWPFPDHARWTYALPMIVTLILSRFPRPTDGDRMIGDESTAFPTPLDPATSADHGESADD